uniref:Pep1 n=1 Tax=Mycosarcoma maydis TaxID=5270 RepID=G0X7D4_MYCMD|nr:Pep1 [Ustilago maydis]AEK86682.1 Pep1 [Ustilago maydis]AEK86688.1 Pep1 [Ustilago maydis]AEK86689.1 Pep1 [Ustilago maydis]AEK86693.1 Pep1 [Ustilago maydis]
MMTTLVQATLLSLALVLLGSTVPVHADAAGAVPLPNFKVDPQPLASTFYWFSSVEVGVCYNPQARVGSTKGALHCTHQENYDRDNNSYTLPQTCVALKPLGKAFSSNVRDSCTNAKGIFNVIVPASSNALGSQAYDAVQAKGGTGGAGTGGTGTDDDTSAPDSNDQEKKGGGLLGGIGSMFGM